MVEQHRFPYRRNPLGADGRTPLFNPLMTYRRPAEVASRYLGVYETEGPNVLRQNNLPNHSIALGMTAKEAMEAGDIVSISTTSNMVEKSVAGHGERIIGVCAKDVDIGGQVEIVTFGPFTLRALSDPPVGSLLAASIEPGKATVVEPDYQGRILGKTVATGRLLPLSRVTNIGFRTGRQPDDIKFDHANQRHVVSYHTPTSSTQGTFTVQYFNLRGIEVDNYSATLDYIQGGSNLVMNNFPRAIVPYYGTDFPQAQLWLMYDRIGAGNHTSYLRRTPEGVYSAGRGVQISNVQNIGSASNAWRSVSYRQSNHIAYMTTFSGSGRNALWITPLDINTAGSISGANAAQDLQRIYSSVGSSKLCWSGTVGTFGRLSSSRLYGLSGNRVTPYSFITVPEDERNFVGEQAWRPLTSVITLSQDYHFIDFWNNNLLLYRLENLGSVSVPDYFVYCVLINLSGQSQFFPGERDYAVDSLITLS